MSQSTGKLRHSYKQAKRRVRQAAGHASDRIATYLPAPVKETLGGPYRHLQMLLLDIGALRLVYPNRHQVADGMWRSAQPLPHHIAKLAKRGIRTIINLRGEHPSPSYDIERAACLQHGITMVDFEVLSRAAPTREEFRAIRDLFNDITYPALMHCKSGADRAGLMSVLYLHFKLGVPINKARKQLSLRFGHIRHARPGVLSYVFDCYLAANAAEPIDFMEWVETQYDAEDVQASFRSKGWANRLVDDIFSRE